jgi:hypothetical protein
MADASRRAVEGSISLFAKELAVPDLQESRKLPHDL